jgi:hypothetical protein
MAGAQATPSSQTHKPTAAIPPTNRPNLLLGRDTMFMTIDSRLRRFSFA